MQAAAEKNDERIGRAILRLLRGGGHIGKERRVSRQAFVLWLQNNVDASIDDRQAREVVELLRRTDDDGALICSSSGCGGYWLAANLDELLESYREERRRFLTGLVTIRERLRRGRRVLSGQMGLGI